MRLKSKFGNKWILPSKNGKTQTRSANHLRATH
jgi:hypothetical protein